MKKRRKKKASRRGAAGRTTRTKKPARAGARKKSRAKARATVRKKKGQKKKKAVPRKGLRREGYVVETLVGLPKASTGPAGLQSGDLQGLSNEEIVDSESVDELLEEGNAFEAGIVAGVEASKDQGGREVRTREVPVDDVPGEYLDED